MKICMAEREIGASTTGTSRVTGENGRETLTKTRTRGNSRKLTISITALKIKTNADPADEVEVQPYPS